MSKKEKKCHCENNEEEIREECAGHEGDCCCDDACCCDEEHCGCEEHAVEVIKYLNDKIGE